MRHRTLGDGLLRAGWLTLALALVSPLHPMGEVLFSAHMTQHELLVVVAAPLLVLGRLSYRTYGRSRRTNAARSDAGRKRVGLSVDGTSSLDRFMRGGFTVWLCEAGMCRAFFRQRSIML